MKLKLLLATLLFSSIIAKAQLSTINETFESFTTGNTAPWPQNNWSIVQDTSGPWVYASGTTDKYIQYYSFMAANAPGYLVTPQIVAPDGSKTLTFKAAITSGSAGGATGTIEVGLVSGVTSADMASFTPIGTIINLAATETQYSLTVPASTKQYIAFKMIGSAQHTAIQMDDVVYSISTLGVTDQSRSADNFRFTVSADNTTLQFVTKKDPKNILIYSATGQKAAEGKLNNQRFDISQLQTGVYYITIETNEGSAVTSKFIKK